MIKNSERGTLLCVAAVTGIIAGRRPGLSGGGVARPSSRAESETDCLPDECFVVLHGLTIPDRIQSEWCQMTEPAGRVLRKIEGEDRHSHVVVQRDAALIERGFQRPTKPVSCSRQHRMVGP